MLIFSEQSVIKDPPFPKLDLTSCRNLMIYLGADLQKRLIPIFHYALNPGGFLFLGTSEGIGEDNPLFKVQDRKNRIYQRKEKHFDTKHAEALTFSQPTPALDSLQRPLAGKSAFPARIPMREMTEHALLQQVVAAAALVDNRGDILYLHGRSGMYLELATGVVGTSNILKMAREGLRQELTVALRKAVETKGIVQVFALRVKTNSHFTGVNLTVRPVTDTAASESPLYLVILEEVASDGADGADGADARVAALRQQLRAKEEYIQSTREELENLSESLKSTNQEMQSVNAELQSTNRELETAKQEKQSANEELSTVNAELQNKVAGLSQASNDMNNLIAGTGIATVFVDFQLRILRFTPAATEIINLILGDVGRPVAHLVPNLVGYDCLVADVQAVLNTLAPTEREVQTTPGKWFLLRILPYRTTENAIEGAVLSFVDITGRKRMEDVVRRSEQFQKDVLNSLPAHIAVLGEGGKILAVNEPWLQFASANGNPATDKIGVGANYLDACRLSASNGDANARAAIEGIALVTSGKQKHFTFEYPCDFPDGPRWFSMEVRRVDGDVTATIVAHTDITARKMAEESLLNLRTAVEQSANTIIITDLRGSIEYVNPAFEKITGYTAAEVAGKNPGILKSGDQDAEFYLHLWATITAGKVWRGEFHNKRKDGSLYWEAATISPVQNDKGETLRFLAIKEDITGRKRAEEEFICPESTKSPGHLQISRNPHPLGWFSGPHAAEEKGGSMLGGILQRTGTRKVQTGSQRKRMAVGKIDKAQTDEADQHQFRIEIGPEDPLPDSCLQDDFEMREHRALADRAAQPREMASLLEVLPEQQPHKLRVGTKKMEIDDDDGSQRGSGILVRFACGKKQSLQFFQIEVNMLQSRLIDPFLAAEVVVNHPLVDPGGIDNLIHGHPVVAFLREQADRLAQQGFAHRLRPLNHFPCRTSGFI